MFLSTMCYRLGCVEMVGDAVVILGHGWQCFVLNHLLPCPLMTACLTLENQRKIPEEMEAARRQEKSKKDLFKKFELFQWKMNQGGESS